MRRVAGEQDPPSAPFGRDAGMEGVNRRAQNVVLTIRPIRREQAHQRLRAQHLLAALARQQHELVTSAVPRRRDDRRWSRGVADETAEVTSHGIVQSIDHHPVLRIGLAFEADAERLAGGTASAVTGDQELRSDGLAAVSTGKLGGHAVSVLLETGQRGGEALAHAGMALKTAAQDGLQVRLVEVVALWIAELFLATADFGDQPALGIVILGAAGGERRGHGLVGEADCRQGARALVVEHHRLGHVRGRAVALHQQGIDAGLAQPVGQGQTGRTGTEHDDLMVDRR